MAEASYDEVMDAKKVDTMKETDRKCPECGGVMDFDPTTGGLYCPYCDHREEIPAENSEGADTAEELDFATAEHTGNCDWGVSQKTVTCKSCGATSVYDALAVASECPYCGSNQVMEASDVKTLAPNGVVLFKITAQQAAENFKRWLGGKWFVAKKVKQSAQADAFKGVYLPYWTFDAKTFSTYTGEYGIDKRVKRGDHEEIVTDWFRTSGMYNENIDDELVAGGTQHDAGILAQIEPFATADNKAYKPEYLAGFSAERYSVGLAEGWERAKKAIQTHLHSKVCGKISAEHHADKTRNVVLSTRYSGITYKYLMLPIWISGFTYEGKVYQFMVNGQTGRVGGRYPVSKLRVFVAIVIVALIIGLLYFMMNN